MVLHFTEAEMEAGFTSHGPMTGTHGLFAVSNNSASKINVDSSVFDNVYNYNGQINWGDVIATTGFTPYNTNSYNTFFVDGMSKIYFKQSSTTDYYQVHVYNPNDLSSGVTKLTSETASTGLTVILPFLTFCLQARKGPREPIQMLRACEFA